ncbi:MAG: TrbC/VirB2 family protein [Alphaproteobacteria bacterium]|nr:TrbC/VirB2 family protein [Alphaproteobacteria bacterium]
MVPNMAMAAGGAAGGGETPMEGVMCLLVEWILGPTGRALATLAIIFIGVGALMGKISWGMAIIVALGIAIVFGAPVLLGLLSGGDEGCGAAAAG